MSLGALDLAAVRSLSNIADVHRLLHEANTRERSIDAELEQLLSRRGQLEDGLLSLHDATVEVRVSAKRGSFELPCFRSVPAERRE